MSSDTLAVIVAEAMALLANLRRRTDIFEDVKLPRQELRDDGGSFMFEGRRVIRSGLAQTTDLREPATKIGAALAAAHDINPLVRDAGPAPDWASPEQIAGLKFLDRLVDSAIAGRRAFPRDPSKCIAATARTFQQQLSAATVEAEWVYPILGGRISGRGVTLSPGVEMRPMRPKDLAELARHEVGAYSGPSAHALLMHTAAMLCIRRSQPAPGTYYRHPENEEILQQLAIATALVAVKPLQLVISWVRSAGPSVFAVEGGEWALGSFSLAPIRNLGSSELQAISQAFKIVRACPEALRSSLPVQRLVSARYRSSPADSLIDVWVGLEAMLMTEDENTELQYRMSLRAARLLGVPQPRAFIREFKKAYEDRSKLVHGSGSRWDQKQQARLQWSHNVLRGLVALSLVRKALPDCIAVEDEMVLAGRPKKGVPRSRPLVHP